MKTCNTCRFKSVSLTGNKAWKCKQFGNIKRFNIACLHGWFCKHFKVESKDDYNGTEHTEHNCIVADKDVRVVYDKNGDKERREVF